MDELLGRQVPHSQTAEQAVLGSMLIDRACIADVSAELGAEDFYFEKNREIFETIYNMYAYGKEVDAVTVLDRMKVLGIYDAESTERYIMELMRVTPTAANVMEYVRIIVERALMRRILGTANEISEMVYGGSGNADFMLESAEQKVYALRKDRTVGGLLPISRVIRTVVDELDVLGREGGGIPGVKTGLTDIDEKILGLNPGDFILIASRPGMGKTSMALNMAVSAAKSSNKTVAVFSLEMTREQLVKRVLSGQAMVEGTKLSKGNLSSEDWRRLTTAALESRQCGYTNRRQLSSHRGGYECPVQETEQSGTRSNRLYSTYAVGRFKKHLGQREPNTGCFGNKPLNKDNGKGIGSSCNCAVSAFKSKRGAPEQAAGALGHQRIGRY